MPVTVSLADYISLSLQELPAAAAQLQVRLSFPNPKHFDNQKRSFSNWQAPDALRCRRIRG